MNAHISIARRGSAEVASALAGGRADDRVFAGQRAAHRRAGSRWDGGSRCWVTPITRAAELVLALRDQDIEVRVDDSLADVLETVRERVSHEAACSRLATEEPIAVPAGLTLYAHQETGIRWIAERAARGLSSTLADDMGLGKTAQALLSMRWEDRGIVVCPSVAKGVWRREIRKWRPDLRSTVLEGRGSFRWPVAGEVVILNFDLLPTASPKGIALFEDKRITETVPAVRIRLIVDEAHKAKNPKTKRTRSLRALSRLIIERSGTATVLTGTPVLNRPSEAWEILGIDRRMQVEAWPGGWSAFKADAGGREGRFGIEWDHERINAEACGAALARVVLRRTKADTLDLPAKIYQDIPVDVGTVEEADDALRALRDRGLDVTTAGLEAFRSGLSFELLSRAREALARAKMPALVAEIDELEESGEGEGSVVVFSAHRAPVDAIARRPGWAAITGDTSAAERSSIEDRFQRGELRGIAATIAAAGVALTLTRAAVLVFCDRAWTPADNSQAEDRCHRIGQDRVVVVRSLVASHPLDERVAELLAIKAETIAKTTDAARGVTNLAAPDERANSVLEGITVGAPVPSETTTERSGLRVNDAPGADFSDPDAVGPLLPIARMFGRLDHAFPTLRIARNLTIRRSTKVEGSLAVFFAGRFGGTIDARGFGVGIPEEPYAILLAWCLDPEAAASAYGHEHGACCFCGRRLDNGESIDRGYGPICADRWGLPYTPRPGGKRTVLEIR